jgi:hypothetical protein
VGVAPTSNTLRPELKDVVDRARAAHPRQVVRLDHPLVVLGDELAGGGEALRGGDRGGQRVEHAVVEADHRAVGLRDRQVLVVARVGMIALRLAFWVVPAPRGRSKPGLGGDAVDRLRWCRS